MTMEYQRLDTMVGLSSTALETWWGQPHSDTVSRVVTSVTPSHFVRWLHDLLNPLTSIIEVPHGGGMWELS